MASAASAAARVPSIRMDVDPQGGKQRILLVRGDLQAGAAGDGGEVEAADLGPAQVGAGELHLGEDGAEEVAILEVRVLQVGPGEVRLAEARAGQVAAHQREIGY